ncbi:MAG: ABC transporter ATP-binding protein/permease [Bacilli bacterium]|nr:ABC transporter ATP-binding protein/permease [Bacilli bacterium]
MITVKNVTKVYKAKKGLEVTALKNININFDRTGMTFILGKSGSGKSTLLNLLGGLDTPTSGEILFNTESLSKYKAKDYDNYRNNYIGFVFQEYNLLDKYNVYENVALPLKLQNIKDYDTKVLEVLEKVGIKDLKDRKINELSGGQKQRVAIARALVKNPKVILADEPTGNLDSESSKIVFELLKELSKDILVIVISHDEESAKIYSDRTIYIKDGEIINEFSNNENVSKIDLTSKSSKLNIKDSLYIAFKNTFNRKGKLLLSILLISITISLFGLSIMQKYIRDKDEAIRLLDKYNANYIRVNKLVKSNFSSGPLKGPYRNTYDIKNLDDKDYETIKEKYKLDFKKANYLYGEQGKIPLLKPISLSEEENSSNTFLDYYVMSSASAFVELDEDAFDFKIIGRKPSNYEEIVINKTYADYLIKNGTYLYEEEFENSIYDYRNIRDNTSSLGERKIYKPNSYDEIVNSNEYIAYGFGRVKIVGIIDEDLSKFDNLLSSKLKDSLNSRTDINIELEMKSVANFYTLKGFKENFDPKITNINYVDLSYENNSKLITLEEDKFNTYDLKEKEVIVPFDYLNIYSNQQFEKQLNEYIISNMDINPSLGSNYYKEEFITKYIKDNNIIGTNIKIVTYENELEEVTNFTIKDIKEIDNYIVNSNDVSKIKYNFITYLETNNISDIKEALNTMEIDGNEYILDNEIITMIASDSFPIRLISVYVIVIALFFLLFALLQLFNYINVTILDNKKEIGILRSMGTSKIDISKIYVIQGIIVASISYIVSLILCNLYAKFENTVFFSSLKSFTEYDVRLIGIRWQSALLMLAVLVIIILLASISASQKIAKMKPIDAINEK